MAKLPPATPPSDYAYGDNPVALQRLLLLAKVFAPCSEALLARLPHCKPDVVIDLGCGPGETTRLLFQTFPASPDDRQSTPHRSLSVQLPCTSAESDLLCRRRRHFKLLSPAHRLI